MDPTQCYLEMYEAMRAGDLRTARERALALRDWLSRGGFPPANYSRQKFMSIWRTFCDALRESQSRSDSHTDQFCSRSHRVLFEVLGWHATGPRYVHHLASSTNDVRIARRCLAKLCSCPYGSH
jgi:hypothetical protein